jgi:hypothetical protein
MVNRAAMCAKLAFLHQTKNCVAGHDDARLQGRFQMETTLQGASRTTHLKIVLVSLVAAIAFVAVGINAKVSDSDANSADRGIVKAGQPTAYAGKDSAAIR